MTTKLRRCRPCLETLEAREVPAVFSPTGLEQELLELLNHMRMDPQAHLARLVDSTNPIHSPDPDVDAALDFFNVSGSMLASQWASLNPAAPLAWSAALWDAAHGHNQQMIAHDQQSHQLPGEPDLGQRATNAGYSNWSALAENIFAFADSPFYAHAGFAIDWGSGPGGMQSPPGHRNNMMNGSYREVGIAVTPESNPATNVGPLVVTQDFGNRSSFGNPWLLGVVFNDLNLDGWYQNGEGLGGVTVQVSGPGGTFETTTMDAGGWQLKLPAGSYSVTFFGGGLASPIQKDVTVGSANAKLDARSQEAGGGGGGNHAPLLATTPAPSFTPIVTGDPNPAGDAVGDLLAGRISDIDLGALQGAAVVGATGSSGGVWQFSLDGGATWTNLGTASASAARLLRAEDRLRFKPNASFGGTATLTLHAWDQTSGTAGGTANLASTGGSTAFSTAKATATAFMNAAPTLSGAPAFGSQNEDATTPVAKQISSLLSGKVADPNSGALKGIALFEVSGSGVWQYSTNGTTWMNLPAVTADHAFLLKDTYRLRFRGAANFNGQASVSYRAWDRTAGAALGFADLTGAVGGASPFSASTATALLTVLPVNDAPILAPGAPTFTPVNMNDPNPAGDLVSALLAGLVSDPDSGAAHGLAVTGLTGTSSGTWQYSLDGGQTWRNFGSVSTSTARLLRAEDRIRFVPKSGFTGTASLSFRAWDQTSGTAGGTALLNTSAAFGGKKAFSSLKLTASVTVGV